MNRLDIRQVSVQAGSRPLLREVSFSVEAGQWWMLAGPNGAGKSTLLSAISGAIPCTGAVLLDDTDVPGMKPSRRGLRIAVMEQTARLNQPYTVEQVVAMGRYAHQRERHGDLSGNAAIEKALCDTGLAELRKRSVMTLSGGELQRVFLAQALCQEPELLILDEPGNNLDLACQKQIFELVDGWRRTPGRAVLTVVHDLSLALKFGTHTALLHQGRLIAAGPTAQVLTRENLSTAWQMDVAAWMTQLGALWEEIR